MLHLPYTLMVLGFVIVGAMLSAAVSWPVLVATVAAYFLGLGIGAHFLDQLPGMGSRYTRHWSNGELWTLGLSAVVTGAGLGVIGVVVLREPWLLALVGVQAACAVGYPLAPVFRGVFHRDSVFAVSWGSLPCLTSYYAQSGGISASAILAAALFAALAVVEIRTSRVSRRRRGVVTLSVAAAASSPSSRSSDSQLPDRILIALSGGTFGGAVLFLGARVLLGA